MARELSYTRASVVDLAPLTPGMHRLTLSVDATASRGLPGVPDEAVLLVFPDDDGHVRLPHERDDSDPYEKARWYTVRHHDPASRQLVIDLVRHGVGQSAHWASRVRPGDRIGVSSSCTFYEPPADTGWQLLVGDLAALPAISRIVESHTDGSPMHAYVEVPGTADQQELELPAGVEVTWVHDGGHPSRLADLCSSRALPDGPGYVFVAGEAAATREARRVLRREHGLTPRRCCVTGYWRVMSPPLTDRSGAVRASAGR